MLQARFLQAPVQWGPQQLVAALTLQCCGLRALRDLASAERWRPRRPVSWGTAGPAKIWTLGGLPCQHQYPREE